MIAAAEIDMGLTGDPDLLLSHRLDAQAEGCDQGIQLASCPRIGLSIGNDPRLQKAGCRHSGYFCSGDRSSEVFRLRLLEEDRQERGRVDDHQRGIPRSS
jgi:hypothetical protein